MDGRPDLALGGVGVQGADHVHPQLDVLALELPHELAVAVAQPVQLAVVQGDQRAVVEGEVDVPVDERGEHLLRDAVGLGDPAPAAVQQPAGDADQQLGEHRVLAGEVPVQPGPADTHGGAYLVDADAVEAALGEEPGGLLEDLFAAGRRVGPGGHAIDSRQAS